MACIDGFVMAVPTANKQEFIDRALGADSLFVEPGANRIIECWGDDIPSGSLRDVRKAVRAEDDETVVLFRVEWPDRKTRDEAQVRMHEMIKTDDRFNPEAKPMPFDGKRLICGGFSPIIEI